MQKPYASLLRAGALLICLFSKFYSCAQVGEYTFTASGSTYTPITGTTWQSGVGVSTNAITGFIPLGFTFNFNGMDYTEVTISSCGFITFGALQPGGGTILPLGSSYTNRFDGAVAGFALDFSVSTGSSSIIYGNDAGDFVVQYTDMARNGHASERITFQIRLTPVTNVITIVYDACTASTADTPNPQVGLRGSSGLDWHNLSSIAADAWTNPTDQVTTGSASATATMLFSAGAVSAAPAGGETFIFTPYAPLATPSYTSIPASENFDAAPWMDGISAQQLPGTSWNSWPAFGDRSWRRHDVDYNSMNSGWIMFGSTININEPASGGTAMFNGGSGSEYTNGYMDYYVDFSTPGPKYLDLDMINLGTEPLNIYLSEDGGASFTLIGSFPANQFNWTSQVSMQLTAAGTSPTSVVRFEAIAYCCNLAIDNVLISGEAVNTCPPFVSPEICFVTTNEDNYNKIIWEKLGEDDYVGAYNVYRHEFGADVYVGSALSTDSSFVVDETVSASEQSFRYRLETVDTCGNAEWAIHAHNTVHLSASAGTFGYHNLFWNIYQAEESLLGVPEQFFYIYRGEDPGNLVLIDSITSVEIFSYVTYTDVTAPDGELYYQVIYVPEVSCSISRDFNTDLISSNIAGLNLEIDLVIEEAMSNAISVYPNPAQDAFTLDLSGVAKGAVPLSLYDTMGKMVYSLQASGMQALRIERNGLSAGVYSLVLQIGERNITKRVVLE